MRPIPILARWVACAGMALSAVSLPALAADYKIIVPAAPGGGWDQLGRAVGQSIHC